MPGPSYITTRTPTSWRPGQSPSTARAPRLRPARQTVEHIVAIGVLAAVAGIAAAGELPRVVAPLAVAPERTAAVAVDEARQLFHFCSDPLPTIVVVVCAVWASPFLQVP